MRPQSRESKGLLADWLADQVNFVVTKEVSHDLNNHSDAQTRKKQLIRFQAFRQAGESTAAWEESRSKLSAILSGDPKGRHDLSDLNHVARAHAAGLRYFITRDERLRKKYGNAASALNVRITSPGEFLAYLWASQDGGYAPAQLQNTDFIIEPLAGVDLNSLAPTFLTTGTVEKKKQLTKKIREFASDAANVDGRVIRTGEGAPVALMMRVTKADSLDVPILRLSGHCQTTIGRHVAHLQSTFAREKGLRVTTVSDPHLSAQTAGVLSEEGFQEADGRWWSVSIPIADSKNRLASVIDSIEGVPEGIGLKDASSLLRKKVISPTVVAELEERFWPMKIKESTLPTYLVPIRPWYAMELFDSELSGNTLFRQMPLGVYREQVYYRSPRPSCGLVAPARLLWYVSQQPEVSGSGMIRACSYLLEVTVDLPNTLYRRNAQLGVYQLDDVRRVGKSGKAMALRFGMTESFPSPVSLDTVREIAADNGCSNLPLRSPWRLPGSMFDDIYKRGVHGPE
jgi:hypothetical protein